MIGFIISHAWSQYYASSPFKNFLDIPEHLQDDFRVIPMYDHMVYDPVVLEQLSKFSALVVDDVYAPHMGFYKTGPRFMIDGDPHRNRAAEIPLLEVKYEWADYILTSACPKDRLEGRHYPRQELRDTKFTYYPHAAPAVPVATPAWPDRDARTVLSGSRGKAVYPYRYYIEQNLNSHVDALPFQSWKHGEYFKEVSKYRGAFTCRSVFNYTVAKYFEIPWLGTLLIGQNLSEEELWLTGLKHGVNCILTENSSEAVAAATALAANPFAYEGLAAAGQNLMMKHHTILNRVRYIQKLVEKVKAGNFKNTDAKDVFKGMQA